MIMQEKWGVGLAAAQDNLKAGITGEHKALMCPYKLGPCWEHGCQMWKLAIEDCGLKRLDPQDAAIEELQAQVDGLVEYRDELHLKLNGYVVRVQELESELASRPTQEQYEVQFERAEEQVKQLNELQKELADARQELETLRAQGGRKSRRKEKPIEREL